MSDNKIRPERPILYVRVHLKGGGSFRVPCLGFTVSDTKVSWEVPRPAQIVSIRPEEVAAVHVDGVESYAEYERRHAAELDVLQVWADLTKGGDDV